MIRLAFFDDGPYLLTEPVLVDRLCERIVEGKREFFTVQHAVSNIERRASYEEVQAWQSGR